MPTLRLLPALLLLTCLALPALAEDEPSAPHTRTIDLRGFETGLPVRGPALAVPPDLIAAGVEADSGGIWRMEPGTDWLRFQEPVLERQAVGTDTLIEVLRSTIGHREDLAEAVAVDGRRDEILVAGPPEAVQAIWANVPWVLAGLAPSVRIDAVLTATSAAGETRLDAMGGARLWPGRWTRIYLQADELGCTPVWDIDVAQESTTTDPWSVGVLEGRELYARYHPGETVSLVEIWSGSVEHLEVVREDVSGIRNVPEANGFGRVSYPTSAVERGYTQLLLPADRAVRRELRWVNGGRSVRLDLRLGAAPSSPGVLERGERGALATIRTGALAAALDFGTRPTGEDEWTERIGRVFYRAAEAHEREGRSYEFSVSPTEGGEVVFLEAPRSELPAARKLVHDTEQHLAARQAHLQVLTVPEAPWREASLGGVVAVGRPVPAEVLAALREGGASPGGAVTLPVLVGRAQGFRVGRSVPGILGYDAELAQQAAALRPVTSARFEGLYGELRVRSTPGGHAARVRGALCWAGREPRAVEMTVRPPVSMAGGKDGAAERRGAGELVELPILVGGHAPIGREVALPDGGARDVLVHAHVRGTEVVLVLLSLD